MPHPELMGLQKGTLLGPYEIVALLGAGGMGEVYRARDERIGRDVAIKVLPPAFATEPERLRRFEKEARATGALNHPNILAVHDVGTHEGSPYIVTELLEGETLRDRMYGSVLTARKAVELAIQIVRGLAAAHEKGIVHRDLKPSNVFVTSDGQVKILDFGLAKVTDPEEMVNPYDPTVTSSSSTEAGAVMGTMGYMSPEQLRGQPADARSDIFAFGCVLYEMLSLRPPFLRATKADTVSAVLYEEPPALDSSGSKVPPSVCQIVRRCLEKRPHERFSSAHDLAFALEAAATDTSGGRAFPAVTLRGRHVRIVLAVAAAVVVAASVFWLIRTTGPAPLPPFRPHKVAGQFEAVSEPALSPNGTEIAYTASDHGRSDIWITDVRGGKPIRLTERPSSSWGPTWFPDGGAIAFSSNIGMEVSIWKVPRFGGTAMLLVRDAQDAAISPAGDRIAFARPETDGYLRIWVAPLGAAEQARRLTPGNIGVWSHRRPVWSPDGRTICFQDSRHLWLVPASGGAPHPLTVGDAVDASPVWSPDGRHVYFVSYRQGTQSLWRQAVTGGFPVRVTKGAGPEKAVSISRDGRRLAFTSGFGSLSSVLVDMQAGTFSTVQGAGAAKFASIAPDRSSIVFESNLAGSSDLWSLPLRNNAPTGNPTRLTDHPGTCAVPVFSPDGRWIAYFRVVEGQRDVWVIPSGGGAPVNFTGDPAIDVEPAWSPDGRQIAFVSDRGGRDSIWAAPFAEGRRTGEPRRISTDEGTASYPSWSPDGKTIAYVLTTDKASEVRAAPADASGPSRGLTAGAQAYMVRWWWSKNTLVVSGNFGEVLPTIRLVAPGGGLVTRLALPASVAPDAEYPFFELSGDGMLVALLQSSRHDEIWVLEAEKGSF